MTATSRMMLMFEGAARNAVRAVKSSRRTILGFISSQYELTVLGRWIRNSATDEGWRSRVKEFSGNYSQKYDYCTDWFLAVGDRPIYIPEIAGITDTQRSLERRQLYDACST